MTERLSTAQDKEFELPRWHRGKESASAGDLGSIPGSGRSPGVGNGNPLQYSCLWNLMVRRAWQTTVHGVTKSQTWLSTHTHKEFRLVPAIQKVWIAVIFILCLLNHLNSFSKLKYFSFAKIRLYCAFLYPLYLSLSLLSWASVLFYKVMLIADLITRN